MSKNLSETVRVNLLQVQEELQSWLDCSLIVAPSSLWPANTEIKRITASNTNPLKSVYLNFHTDNNIVKTIPGTAPSATAFYKLEVTGSNGYAKIVAPLLFADDSFGIDDYAGLIHLKHKPGNTSFNLLDNNGYLFTLRLGTFGKT